MKSPPRVAVIGTGSLGKEHARIYAAMAAAGEVIFAGVHDAIPETARAVADRLGVRAFGDLAEAMESAEVFSVVTPTSTHFETASHLLRHNRHVLVEKPMTDNAADATALVELAREKGCVLLVGHVERFNPVFQRLQEMAPVPRFIEAHRLSPYPARSTDIGVVLDLMIHDLDVILAFVNSPVVAVDAVGIPVLSRSEDIANARLRFANGCIANLTASRVSTERMRKIRVFSGGAKPAYVSLDYRAQTGYALRLARSDEKESSLLKKLLHARDSSIVVEFAGRRIVREPVPITREEPLQLELKHFIRCVTEQGAPLVSGESAKHALDLAFTITRQIEAQVPPELG
ncbi:MAG: Gfo/Idh/MocA family oxidoreductase [Verrucomicrobiae bacterium]|nr:Gfo/Idh/MocA family oxidoreductase [Verrucomicrobiae bacterium]